MEDEWAGEFGGDENVLVIIAHDKDILEMVDCLLEQIKRTRGGKRQGGRF